MINIKPNKYKLKWTLNLGGNLGIIEKETDYCNDNLTFNYELGDISLGDNRKTMCPIHTKMISIIIIEKGFFSNSNISAGAINLQELETNHTIEDRLILEISKK